MTIVSRTAEALIDKAKDCYELGLIDITTLERVTERALTQPGYTALLDLPLDFRVKEARALEQQKRRNT
jgi:hypothetical protein